VGPIWKKNILITEGSERPDRGLGRNNGSQKGLPNARPKVLREKETDNKQPARNDTSDHGRKMWHPNPEKVQEGKKCQRVPSIVRFLPFVKWSKGTSLITSTPNRIVKNRVGKQKRKLSRESIRRRNKQMRSGTKMCKKIKAKQR